MQRWLRYKGTCIKRSTLKDLWEYRNYEEKKWWPKEIVGKIAGALAGIKAYTNSQEVL